MTRSSRFRASYYFYRFAIGCFDESQGTAVPQPGPAGLRVALLAAWVVLALLNSFVNLSVAEERSVRNEEDYLMRSVLFALLAPAAIAATLTASASATVLSPKGPVIDKSTAASDVAYRAVRRTTVRGPRGVYRSRTVVRGGRYYGARGVYARRGVYVRGGRYYGAGYYGPRYYGGRNYASGYYRPRYYGYYGSGYYGSGYYRPRYYGYYRPRVYASRGVYVRGGRYYGRGGVYARSGFHGHRAVYRGGGRVYASRAVGVRRR
jgi:hypothetical protein